MARRAIYLDNASTSWPKPPAVADAISKFLAEGPATPGRGGHGAARRAGRIIERLRARLAALVGAPSSDRIVLTSGATESLNTALLGMFLTGPRGDRAAAPPRVVTTVLEHNAVLRPLRFLERAGLVEARIVGCGPGGVIEPEELLREVDDRTALVALTSASNVLGTLQPVGEVGARLREQHPRVLFLVDGSQSVGLAPVDMQRDGIDLLAFSGHKALLGPPGTGVLAIGARVPLEEAGDGRAALRPVRFGGTGGESDAEEMPADPPARFEPGTPNTLGFAGLLAAMEDPGRPAAADALAHERSLIVRAIDGLARLPGVRLLAATPGAGRVGVLSFTIEGLRADEAAAALDASFGIAVRGGLHCAPLVHKAMGTAAGGGAVRISPGPYSTVEEIDALIEAVGRLAGL